MRPARRIPRALAAVAGYCGAYPKLSLVLIALTSGVCGLSARNITVNSDLISLLPAHAPSVIGLKQYKARGGSVGFVALLLRGDDREALLRYAETLVPQLQGLPSVDYAEYRRSSAFFEERLLYYLDVDALDELAERIEDRVNWERRRSHPLLVNLTDEAPPTVDLDFEGAELPASLKAGKGGPYYFNDTQDTLLLLVKPRALASDLAFAHAVLEDVRGVLQANASPPGIGAVDLGGRFSKRVQQQTMLARDVRVASWGAGLLIFIYLLMHFRRVSGILLALAPLLVGLLWTFGLTAYLFGELNILSAFVGAILMGLGIDHGLHLLGAYSAAAASGKSTQVAVCEVFGATGQLVVLAAVTTGLGFLGLAISDFRAFREFGLIAALGGMCVMAAYLVCLPPLLHWFPRPHASTLADNRVFLGWVRGIGRHRFGVLAGASILVVLGISQVPSLSFDYDFAALDGRSGTSFGLDQEIDGILGRQQASLALLTRDEADAQTVALTLRTRKAQGGSGIDLIITSRELVPVAQLQKQAQLLRMQDAVANIDPESLSAPDRAAILRLRRLARPPPFSQDDFPEALKKELALGGAESGGLVLVFPSVRMSDGRAVLQIAHELTDVPIAAGRTVSATGEAMVLADVLRMVFDHTPKAILGTAILVLICLVVFLPSIKSVGLAYVPAMLSVILTLGLATMLGLRLNYLNVVFVPVLFGLAVDSGVHLSGLSPEGGMVKLAQTARAIFAASATSGAGFGALCLAQHPGLKSLGQLALLGVGTSLAVSLVWLISLMLVFEAGGEPVISR